MNRSDYLKKHCIHQGPALAIHFGECALWIEYQQSMRAGLIDHVTIINYVPERHERKKRDMFDILNVA